MTVPLNYTTNYFRQTAFNYIWDVALLEWVPSTAATATGGAGDASAANQVTQITRATTANTLLTSIDGKLTSPLHVDDNAGSLTVDGTFWQATQPVSAVSLPLPTGASTSGKQDTLLTELQLKADLTETQPVSVQNIPHVIVDSIPAGGSGLTDTELRASDVKVTLDGEVVPVTGTFWQATQPVSGPIDVTQATASSLKTELWSGAKGTSTPLVLTALPLDSNQNGVITFTYQAGSWNITSITNPVAVTGTFWQAAQPITDNAGSLTVDGTVALSAGAAVIGHVIADTGSTTAVTGNVTVIQGTGSNLHTVLDSGTLSTITNVVHVDDNTGSLTIDNANLDVALSTRLKPADTLTGVTTVGTITNVVHVDDNAGSLTVDGSISVTKTDLTPSAPTVAAIAITTGQAVAAAATRKGLILRNLSTSGQRISLGFGSSAVLDSGITLYPQDVFCMEEYDFDTGAVNAISSAASGSLAIQEYLT